MLDRCALLGLHVRAMRLEDEHHTIRRGSVPGLVLETVVESDNPVGRQLSTSLPTRMAQPSGTIKGR